jgi:hypothetical protein
MLDWSSVRWLQVTLKNITAHGRLRIPDCLFCWFSAISHGERPFKISLNGTGASHQSKFLESWISQLKV